MAPRWERQPRVGHRGVRGAGGPVPGASLLRNHTGPCRDGSVGSGAGAPFSSSVGGGGWGGGWGGGRPSSPLCVPGLGACARCVGTEQTGAASACVWLSSRCPLCANQSWLHQGLAALFLGLSPEGARAWCSPKDSQHLTNMGRAQLLESACCPDKLPLPAQQQARLGWSRQECL